MEPQNARGRREGGQMLILFVLALGVLMGMVAMSVDVGMILHERRSLQNAADAAALAGVSELPESPDAAEAKALEWAENNGYTSENGATITVNTPYQGDPNSQGDPNAIEVIIEVEMPFLFARALGLDSVDVSARAVAGFEPGTIGNNAAILVLNEHECSAFQMGGNNDLSITNNGAIMVNSDCDNEQNGAINKAGSSVATIEGGIFYYEEGDWSISGSGALIPEPEPVPSRIADPLAGLTPPDLYAIGTSPDSGGTAADPFTRSVNGAAVTLHPGVYWGGLKIVADQVTLLPGTYIMAGGGFAISSAGTISGDEILFYNTFDPESQILAGQCGSIDLRGSAAYTFTAPTSGTYKDVLFWQDEACTNAVRIAGSGEGGGGGSGIFYAPSAELELVGGGDLGALQMIVDTIKIGGGGTINIEYYPYVDIPVPGYGPKLVE
ncbi:MAG: hypothetical protein IIA23_03445 [Chloroflexi bacterium]|nr:hypothetical protein [Chloroflexota bacterium]